MKEVKQREHREDKEAAQGEEDEDDTEDGESESGGTVQPTGGVFTVEEDELLWNAYVFNSDNPTTAPGPFGFPPGYVGELAELLGRHANAVNRRLRDLKAQHRKMEE